MARPNKNNIGAFPFDVDFFDNKIMVRINGEFGAKGMIIVVKLLCAVYQQGYFIKWSIDEQYLMKRYLSGISVELIDQVLQRLLKWGFFNEALFRSAQILTSVEIQRNYFTAIKRRTSLRNTTFPYLLIDPVHPNDVSAYKNRVSVCNNEVSVYNNSENVAETEVYVIQNPNNGNNQGLRKSLKKEENVTEKEFLYTETPISVYNNSDKGNNIPDLGDRNKDSGYKNPIIEHYAAKNELMHTETGVSVYNNSGLCKQKPNGPKNNNSGSVINNGDNVNNNPVTAYNNGETVNNNSNSDSNNPDNIIYNSISTNNNNKSYSYNKEGLQNSEFGEQKGKECLQELESDLQNFLKDEIWIDGFCLNHNIQKSKLPELLEKFKIECISSGKIDHIDYQDTKKHFHNWLRIYLQNQHSSQTSSRNYENPENRQKAYSNRRGTPAHSKKEKNYHASL